MRCGEPFIVTRSRAGAEAIYMLIIKSERTCRVGFSAHTGLKSRALFDVVAKHALRFVTVRGVFSFVFHLPNIIYASMSVLKNVPNYLEYVNMHVLCRTLISQSCGSRADVMIKSLDRESLSIQ